MNRPFMVKSIIQIELAYWYFIYIFYISGSKDVAQVLLENGGNVNAKNIDGYTPLHYAASKGKYFDILSLKKNAIDKVK